MVTTKSCQHVGTVSASVKWPKIPYSFCCKLNRANCRSSSNWTRPKLYAELYFQYSCGKLFSVFLIKTLIFLCIFLCFLKILLCFWLCFLSILGLQSPWKHCIWYWNIFAFLTNDFQVIMFPEEKNNNESSENTSESYFSNQTNLW